jgi:hypothetical protein
MSSGNLKHRLAAILSADVAGYSRLMAEDELGTIGTFTEKYAATQPCKDAQTLVQVIEMLQKAGFQ